MRATACTAVSQACTLEQKRAGRFVAVLSNLIRRAGKCTGPVQARALDSAGCRTNPSFVNCKGAAAPGPHHHLCVGRVGRTVRVRAFLNLKCENFLIIMGARWGHLHRRCQKADGLGAVGKADVQCYRGQSHSQFRLVYGLSRSRSRHLSEGCDTATVTVTVTVTATVRACVVAKAVIGID